MKNFLTFIIVTLTVYQAINAGPGQSESIAGPEDVAAFSITPTTRFVGRSAGTTSFTMNSTVGWSVTDNAGWLTATKTSGSNIAVSFIKNTTASVRTATITATGTGGLVAKVKVVQFGQIFSISPTSRVVSRSAGATSFTVSSTVGWSVSDNATWLTATKTSGTNIAVSFTKNPTTIPRTATITASGTGGLVKKVKVTQFGQIFSVSPISRNVSRSAGTTSFTVNTTVGWSVTDNAGWLTATKTSSSKISVSFTKNSTTSTRVATITATGTGGLIRKVKVIQAGQKFSISPISRAVSYSAGATSFTMNSTVGWSVTDNASWLTATKTSGSNIAVSYSANTTGSTRTATIKASGTGGLVRTVTVKQAGVHFSVSPLNRNVTYSAGTSSFTVNSTVGWSVTDNATWLKATKTSGSNIAVSYSANTTGATRIAKIKVNGTGGLVRIVTVKQAGVHFSISPLSRDVSRSAGTTFFTMNSSVGWSVTDNATWLTATKTSSTNIAVSFTKNPTTSPRTATITASGTGGLVKKVKVIQAGQIFSVSPISRNVSNSAGTSSFTVNSTVGWSVTDNVSWLTATKTSGTNIAVSFTKNTLPGSRSAKIKVSGTGGLVKTVKVIQEGTTTFILTPGNRNVTSSAGTTSFTMNSTVGWSVTDDASWLKATKTSATNIAVSYKENTSTSSRTATITATGTGGLVKTATVIQEGTTTFILTPTSQNVTSSAGTTSFTMNSSVGWSVADDASWLTATKTSATDIEVSYEENTSSSSRTATITATGTGGITKTAKVIQEGTATFILTPGNRNVTSPAGTTSFTMNSSVGWSVTDDAIWLTATKTSATDIEVSYEENTSTSPRTATITATGTGGLTQTATVVQAGVGIAPILSISPLNDTLAKEPATIIFEVESNIEWSVSNSADWLKAVKTNATTLTISCKENSGVGMRSAKVTLSGTGVTSQVLKINQEGVAPSLIVEPIAKTVSSATGTTTFSVVSNINWNINESSEWLTATKKNDTLLTITYAENTESGGRIASITLSGDDVDSLVISLMQDGAIATAVTDLFEQQTISLYPNPANDKVYLKFEKDFNREIEISIYDVSGKLMYSKFLSNFSSKHSLEMDISSFKNGLYMVKLKSQQSVIVEKVIKK